MTVLERQLEASITHVRDQRAPAPLALVHDDGGISVDAIVARVEKVKMVQARLMQAEHHYGKVPGTDKPTLLKPGAELLMLTFQLDAQFKREDERDGEHLESVVTCTLYHAPTNTRVGSGIGSCSTREKKYAWRSGERKCPKCDAPAIRPSKYPDCKWFCFVRAGGCGAKFQAGEGIESQQTGRVPNPDLADQYNTVRKMACKRALVAAVLTTCGASELFTQDVEDMHDEQPRTARDSPHRAPDEDPEAEGDASLFADMIKRFADLESGIATCRDYSTMLELRELLGSRSKPSNLTRGLQAATESGQLSVNQRTECSRIWMRLNRQLEKLERELPKPGPEASFVDP